MPILYAFQETTLYIDFEYFPYQFTIRPTISPTTIRGSVSVVGVLPPVARAFPCPLHMSSASAFAPCCQTAGDVQQRRDKLASLEAELLRCWFELSSVVIPIANKRERKERPHNVIASASSTESSFASVVTLSCNTCRAPAVCGYIN